MPDFYDTHPNEWNEKKTRNLADLLPKLLDLLYFSLEKNISVEHNFNETKVAEKGASQTDRGDLD